MANANQLISPKMTKTKINKGIEKNIKITKKKKGKILFVEKCFRKMDKTTGRYESRQIKERRRG
jgi:hypothetical protein